VIRRLRHLGCRAVRGNADGWLLDGLPAGRSEETQRLAETVAWARAQLDGDDIAYLAALPASLRLDVGGVELLCVHGSPRSEIEPLLATTRDEQIEEVVAAAGVDVLAAGHTHLQLLRRQDQSLLINPGSVGLPLSLALQAPLPSSAEYALAVVDHDALEIAFRRLATDVDALQAASAALPHQTWASDLARRISRWNARAE
jgi:putative phosphoesterase